MSSHYQLVGKLTDTSPASATTALSSGTVSGLGKYSWFVIEADIIGGTGGTIDVYLQREIETNVWRDWLHFAQVAAATTKHYTVQSSANTTIVEVGVGDATTATVALAADTFVGGHPGDKVRAVYVAGAGTSAGAAQAIRVYGHRE